MSVASDSGNEKNKSVSTRVDRELADEFDMALKKAQVNGDIDLNASRSEAIRRLMRAAIEDPSLFAEPEDE